MKFLTLLLFSLLSFTSKAQSDYTIEYTMLSGVEFDSSGNPTYTYKKLGWLYIYSDSLSFFSHWQNNLNKVVLTSRESHGGILRFLKTDSTYDNMSIAFKMHYFVSRPKSYAISSNWEILNDTLNILGYTCTKAVNDSGAVAWFTNSIPVNAGPLLYYGLPGIILQINDYGRMKTIISAKSISKNNTPIIFPEKYAFISWDVCDAIHTEKIPKNNVEIYSWQRRF